MSDGQIKNSQFKIPFFVDSTTPPDHKCGGCEHRVRQGGGYTCKLVDQRIDLKRGTCLLWEEGPEKHKLSDLSLSRVTPQTAGYIEADTVNCGTCVHHANGRCGVWDGKVKDGQCCVVWEQRKNGIGFDKPYQE